VSGPIIRSFFFDDNVELEGGEDSPGICNLRDVDTGEFVPFGVGSNGFQSEVVGRHTIVHYSTEYRNVIVKANILDALEDGDYFLDIIRTYAQPGEKVVIFMDVNSTIMCADSCAGKDMGATLLSTMFELIEVRPSDTCEVKPHGGRKVNLSKPTSLKQLVKAATEDDHEAYSSFWTLEKCQHLLRVLAQDSEIRWTSRAGPVDAEIFARQFQTYMREISTELVCNGIARSWFSCFSWLILDGDNTVILNSFGVDTQKVVSATVHDNTDVMHIAVNYELWSPRDVEKFESQYRDVAMHAER